MDRVIKAQSIIYPGPTRYPSDYSIQGRTLKLPTADEQDDGRNRHIPVMSELDFDRSRQYR